MYDRHLLIVFIFVQTVSHCELIRFTIHNIFKFHYVALRLSLTNIVILNKYDESSLTLQ